jgi:hypothetical protein
MKDEIIIYQADEASTRLEVRIEEDTVWLTQSQMADLFQTTRNNITLPISNIFKEKELNEISVGKDSLLTASDGKKYKTKFYNLDVIISVGYRVKSIRGTQFRIWANKVLKDYLLKGYVVNQRFERIENDIHNIKNRIEEIDVQINTRLSKAVVYSSALTKEIKLDLKKYSSQYPDIKINQFNKSHDRFLIIDRKTIYHLGASLKDLGKKWFAFSILNCEVQEILKKLDTNQHK